MRDSKLYGWLMMFIIATGILDLVTYLFGEQNEKH